MPIKITPPVQMHHTTDTILMKFDTGESYKKVSSHFRFHFSQTNLTTISYNNINTYFSLTRYDADNNTLVTGGGMQIGQGT
jgi:hypothetical protein